MDKHVDVVRLGETLVQCTKKYFPMHLELTVPTALSRFLLIDPLVAEPAQRIVDIKHVPQGASLRGGQVVNRVLNDG